MRLQRNKMILLAVLVFTVFTPSSAQTKKVLFVLSAEDTLLLDKGKMERQTGVFLNEFYMAYKAIVQHGYMVDFATPNGIKATIDQESLHNDYWEEELALKEEAIDFWHNDANFSSPMKLEEAIQKNEDYIGIVIPGGQGLMVDLIHDPNIPVILELFTKHEKAIGLICHAPALITTIPREENPFLGYTVNSVSPMEEIYIEKLIMKGKPENRKIAKQLKKLGLEYETGWPGKGFATRDRNLVTSQNPFSGESFNTLFLELLTKY